MKLLLFVKGFFDGVEVAVDLACDVALEAAHDLSFALAFGGATLDVETGSWVFARADEHDAAERFAVEAFGVVAGGDEQRCSGVDPDADACDQARCGGRDECADDIVDAFDPGVERLDSPGEFA